MYKMFKTPGVTVFIFIRFILFYIIVNKIKIVKNYIHSTIIYTALAISNSPFNNFRIINNFRTIRIGTGS